MRVGRATKRNDNLIILRKENQAPMLSKAKKEHLEALERINSKGPVLVKVKPQKER